jgi:hypothetical protein
MSLPERIKEAEDLHKAMLDLTGSKELETGRPSKPGIKKYVLIERTVDRQRELKGAWRLSKTARIWDRKETLDDLISQLQPNLPMTEFHIIEVEVPV